MLLLACPGDCLVAVETDARCNCSRRASVALPCAANRLWLHEAFIHAVCMPERCKAHLLAPSNPASALLAGGFLFSCAPCRPTSQACGT